MPKLDNEKHERFAQEYLVDLNATQAAIRSGFSEATAGSKGWGLLKIVAIESRVQELAAERSARTAVAADRVLLELAAIAFVDIGEFVKIQKDGTTRIEFNQDNRSKMRTLSEIQFEEDIVKGPDGEEVVDRYKRKTKIKQWDKVKALEMLCKHLRLYEPMKMGDGVNPRDVAAILTKMQGAIETPKES